MDILWIIFEIIGTIAFAISGALVGINKKMDIFGIAMLALMTAIGGGIVRDVLVGRIPPNSLQTSLYVVITLIVTLLVFMLHRAGHGHRLEQQYIRWIYLTADALGLASFTVTGASVGIMYFPNNGLLAVVLALSTAVGGGMIRDVLAHRTPSVLKEEVYALPAIIGGTAYFYMGHYVNTFVTSYVAFTIVFIIRMLAIRFNWHLPKAR